MNEKNRDLIAKSNSEYEARDKRYTEELAALQKAARDNLDKAVAEHKSVIARLQSDFKRRDESYNATDSQRVKQNSDATDKLNSAHTAKVEGLQGDLQAKAAEHRADKERLATELAGLSQDFKDKLADIARQHKKQVDDLNR